MEPTGGPEISWNVWGGLGVRKDGPIEKCEDILARATASLHLGLARPLGARSHGWAGNKPRSTGLQRYGENVSKRRVKMSNASNASNVRIDVRTE
jgi:hypothetical protein